MTRAVLVGAGRMGWAMARGWLADPEASGIGRIDVLEPFPSAEVLQAERDGLIGLNADAGAAGILILAVKPQSFAALAPALAPFISPETLVVSVMAGVPIDRIAALTGARRIVRAMPNTPGAIGRGVTGFALSAECAMHDAEAVMRLLAPLGAVVGPLPESQIDAVTAISGSGPAYVFLLAECLERAALGLGLDAEAAALLARRTVTGSAALLEAGGDPVELRRAVTSPNGTTAAALSVLMSPEGLDELLGRAVRAAEARARDLASVG
jgi:pyrroline-5-carboxylate reductase